MRYLLLAISLLLAACASSETPDPVGTGSGVHELKTSPCACTEIPMVLPEHARV